MRLTEGLDSGPVALQRAVAIGAADDFGSLAARLAELGGELLRRGARPPRGGALEFAEQDDGGRHLRGEDRSRRAAARPGAAGRSGARARIRGADTRTSAPSWSSPAASASACARRAPSSAGDAAAREFEADDGVVCCSAATPGSLRSAGPAGGQATDGGAEYLRGRESGPARRGRALSAPTPARLAAYEILRRTFEQGAWADRAFAAAATRAGPRGARARAGPARWPTARSSGAAPRDHSSACSRGGAAAQARPAGAGGAAPRPLRAPLRRRRPTTPPSARRWSSAKGMAESAPRRRRPGSSTRSCAAPIRERGELLGGARRRRRRRGAAIAHSMPQWLARAVVGGARRREAGRCWRR